MNSMIRVAFILLGLSLTLSSCQEDTVTGTLTVRVDCATGITTGSVYLKKDTVYLPHERIEQYEYAGNLSALHEAFFRDLPPDHYIIYVQARDSYQHTVQGRSAITIYPRHRLNDHTVTVQVE